MTGILRITSRCFAVLSIMTVALLIGMLQTGNGQIKAWLDQIEGRQLTCNTSPTDRQSALLACAIEFANRINPPVRANQQLTENKTQRERNPVQDEKKQQDEIKIVMVPKYELLGTVTYESFPEKSLALIKTKANRYEWFTAGQKIGHHRILEITNGSMIIMNGPKQQRLSVPSKPGLVLLKEG